MVLYMCTLQYNTSTHMQFRFVFRSTYLNVVHNIRVGTYTKLHSTIHIGVVLQE
jgi:hypothetical protein